MILRTKIVRLTFPLRQIIRAHYTERQPANELMGERWSTLKMLIDPRRCVTLMETVMPRPGLDLSYIMSCGKEWAIEGDVGQGEERATLITGTEGAFFEDATLLRLRYPGQ